MENWLLLQGLSNMASWWVCRIEYHFWFFDLSWIRLNGYLSIACSTSLHVLTDNLKFPLRRLLPVQMLLYTTFTRTKLILWYVSLIFFLGLLADNQQISGPNYGRNTSCKPEHIEPFIINWWEGYSFIFTIFWHNRSSDVIVFIEDPLCRSFIWDNASSNA